MSITIPKNVRQMGEPEEKRKIYVEDYVVTYLKQYAKEEILESRGAILLGEAQQQEGMPYLFIRSALGLEESAGAEGTIAFTEELWMRVYEEMEQYFPGQEILGWFLSTPGFPPEISYEILSSHRNCFSGWDKVLFMEDPTEGEEAFFAMEQGSLVRQQGYFIFYERNQPMQQYMLEKRGGKSVDSREEFTDRAARSFRTMVQERKEQSSQKRVMTFLYGVSTFLVLVVLVIGVTMINNYEKMEQVELALTDLTQNLEAQQGMGKTGTEEGQHIAAYNNQGLSAGEVLAGAPGTGEEAGSTGEGAEGGTGEEAGSIGEGAVGAEGGNPEGAGSAGEGAMGAEEGGSGAGAESDGSGAGDGAEGSGTEASGMEPGVEAGASESGQENGEAPEHASPAAEASGSYIVQKGDTLLSISRKIYGNDRYIKEICRLNNIDDINMIYEGEKILLP